MYMNCLEEATVKVFSVSRHIADSKMQTNTKKALKHYSQFFLVLQPYFFSIGNPKHFLDLNHLCQVKYVDTQFFK